MNVDIRYSFVGVDADKEEAPPGVGILHSIRDPQSLLNCNSFMDARTRGRFTYTQGLLYLFLPMSSGSLGRKTHQRNLAISCEESVKFCKLEYEVEANVPQRTEARH